LLADNTPRVVEGDIVRLGPVRTVASTTPFSTKTHEEHSQQIDVRLRSIPDSVVRVTLYAPVEEAFPRIACGDSMSAALAMHPEEDISIRACGMPASIYAVKASARWPA